MGMPGFRRAKAAERTVCLVFMILLLHAPTIGAPAARAADPDPDDLQASGEPEPGAAPVHPVGGVTVTATGAERDILEVPGHVTVIEREEIDESGARSVPELLKRQPGLFLTSSTSNPAGVRLESRGFANGAGNGSSLLVQVNGRRVNTADGSVADWALIDLDDVVSVEILRGPASALYGDNAIGGVINIRTRPAEGPPRATLRSRIGRYGTHEGSVKAAGTFGPVTGSLFASGLETDGYRHGADFDHEDVNGSLQADLWDRVVVGVSGGRYHDDRGLPGALAVDEFQNEVKELGRRARDPQSVGTGQRVESRFVEGWLDAEIVDDVLLQVQPYYRWRDDDSNNVFDAGTDFVGTHRGSADKSSLGLLSKLQIDIPILGHRNRAIVGFEFLRDETDRSDLISSPFFDSDQVADISKEIHAVFVQEELNLSESLLLTAGVRFDHAEYDLKVRELLAPSVGARARPDYDVWSPKAALTWRFLPMASAYFSYARGFRLPNFDENSPTLTGGRPVIPDLDVQTSHSFEIGSTWSGERIEATAAFYWMNVDDEIVFNPLLNCTEYQGETYCFGQNDNFDRVRHRGVELTLAVQLLEWLSVYGSYTFDDVVVTDSDVAGLEGSRMPITPRHRGNLGLLAELPYDLELTANATFVGERVVANDFDRRAVSLDSYATVDFAGAWRPSFGEHLEGALSVGVYNVTSAEYDGLAVRSPSTPSRVGFYPAAKRTWSVGLALTVKQ